MKPTHLLPLLIVLLICGCTTARLPLSAMEATKPLNDRRIDRQISLAGQKIAETGAFTSAAKLQEQLKRSNAVVRTTGPSSQPLPPTGIYAQLRDRVVIIAGLYKCGRCSNWHSWNATAFAAGESDVFLTNYHVIEGTNYVALLARSADGKILPVTEVIAANKQSDFAWIRIPGMQLTPIPLRADAPPGTPVCVISHPRDRTFSLTTGIVSRYFEQPEKPNGPDTEWLQITAEFGVGSSGAPILDDCGNAIGIVSRTQAVHYGDTDETASRKKPEGVTTTQLVFRDCVPMRSVLSAIR